MELIEVIERKKLGFALNEEEIDCFVKAAVDPASADYQLSALLMAIRLNGMTAEETALLTPPWRPGDMLTADLAGSRTSTHRRRGRHHHVGAAPGRTCGAKVLKMSGRGLGHTGGTIDKLESIRGCARR